ncbi:uncharacterized protein LOC141621849 [Silene latifolia]|uniref:uncharacterized protein LOC141621849 n=1 Tax=Silene latifolia TaxID=37657 RepID=UPI003D77479C
MRVDSAEARRLIGWNLAPKAAAVPGLVPSSYVRDYFAGKTPALVVIEGRETAPPPCTAEQRVCVGLWWFLSSIYLGDKGERLSTKLLPFLSDLSSLGHCDWVTAGFAVLIRFMRVMVRPESMEKGTSPTAVGPGLLLEAWVYSYFLGLAPKRTEPVEKAYPVVRDWVMCRMRSRRSFHDICRWEVNALQLDGWVPRPWEKYAGPPPFVAEVLRPRSSSRLLLRTSMGPVWYLGECLARQCSRDVLTVPIDPPRTMFREPSEAEREADLAGVGGDALLLPGEDYSAFLYGRLAYWPIVEVEAAGIEPPEYSETLEYTDTTGMTTISELRDFDVAVRDAGMDDWQHLIRRLSRAIPVRGFVEGSQPQRATAVEALADGRGRQRERELERELAQYREETARLLRELEVRDAEVAALEARVVEVDGDEQ